MVLYLQLIRINPITSIKQKSLNNWTLLFLNTRHIFTIAYNFVSLKKMLNNEIMRSRFLKEWWNEWDLRDEDVFSVHYENN